MCAASRPPAPRNAARKAAASRRPRAGAALDVGARFTHGVEVAVAAATGALSYGLPAAITTLPKPGTRVRVPIRGRLHVGVIWRVAPVADLECPVDKLRPIDALLDDEPLLPEPLLRCLEFAARYYQAPLGQAMRLALPAPLRRTGVTGDEASTKTRWMVGRIEGVDWPTDLRKSERRVLEHVLAHGEVSASDLRRSSDPLTGTFKRVAVPHQLLEDLAARGLLRLSQEHVRRDPLGMRADVSVEPPPPATDEQIAVLAHLSTALQTRKYGGFVLRGVTGSGKTEVYLQLIAEALEQGRGALVLVPEIALTPQLVQRFRGRFGDRVAALHSGMSDGERLDQHGRVRRGEARIVIGPRSALFAPLFDLGVIILDECHDPSFKQQSGLRYHARDLALVRARESGAVCVLGSATPGCEEMVLVSDGRLTLLEMRRRVADRPMPEAFVIDLREAERLRDPDDESRPSLLSVPLRDAMVQTIARGEQVIVLHNRRGYATTVVCAGCGDSVECPDCAISLTWHQRQGRLRCHYCNHSVDPDQPCESCSGRNFLRVGTGTERIVHTLERELPGARVARFDRDTATGQRMHELLKQFRDREIDVLVGTQMLAKGHDFPSVTLVGVLLAETGLRIPDFRAAERTFQLLTQVAGRAGRGDRPGQVLVQSWAPEHPAIMSALRHDHPGFLAQELERRRLSAYPPYSHLALLELRHTDHQRTATAARILAEALRGHGADARGPVAAGVAKLRGVHRYHVLLRAETRATLHGQLRWVQDLATNVLPPGVQLFVDVDPADFS